MSENLFDKFIKDKLENHVSPVPANMWERISKNNKPLKRGARVRKTGFLILIAGLFGSGLYWFSYIQSSKTNETHSPRTFSHADKQHSSRMLNQHPLTSPQTAQPSPSLTNKNTRLPSSSKKQNRVAGNMAGANDRVPQTIPLQHGSYKKVQSAGNINSLARINGLKSADGNRYKRRVNNQVNSFYLRSNAGTANNSLNKDEQFTRSIFNIATDENNTRRLVTNTELLNKLKSYKTSAPVGCPPAMFRARRNLYVEVFASPEYAKKVLVKGVGTSDEYLKSKDSVESFRAAFTAGIRINKMLGEHLLLKAGLQYSQISEKFNYRSPIEKRFVTVITMRTIIRGPNDTLRVSDTSTVEQTGYRVVKTFNRYHSVDVPVILGYEWGGENFRAGANAAVILNVYSWQHSQTLDTSRLPVAFNIVAGGRLFKTNIGMGLYAGFSLIKRMNDNIEIFAEPYFRYNLSNMTSESNPFRQKFNVGGINFGVRYKLSGSR